MDGTTIFVILLLGAILGIVLFLRIRSGKSRSTPTPPPSAVTPVVVKESSHFRPDLPPEAPKHNSVYAYAAPPAAICCPYCDGENPPYAQACRICGNSLKR